MCQFICQLKEFSFEQERCFFRFVSIFLGLILCAISNNRLFFLSRVINARRRGNLQAKQWHLRRENEIDFECLLWMVIINDVWSWYTIHIPAYKRFLCAVYGFNRLICIVAIFRLIRWFYLFNNIFFLYRFIKKNVEKNKKYSHC